MTIVTCSGLPWGLVGISCQASHVPACRQSTRPLFLIGLSKNTPPRGRQPCTILKLPAPYAGIVNGGGLLCAGSRNPRPSQKVSSRRKPGIDPSRSTGDRGDRTTRIRSMRRGRIRAAYLAPAWIRSKVFAISPRLMSVTRAGAKTSAPASHAGSLPSSDRAMVRAWVSS